MTPVRRLLPILLLVPALAACGSSKQAESGAGLSTASSRTVAGGTASFTLTINGTFAGNAVQTSETGALSFAERKAHFYKLIPGGGIPQEIVLVGPFDYTNANAQAFLNDGSVPPWTKLDTRRVPSADRTKLPDELAHVRVLAYLADGVADAKQIGSATVDGENRTHFRGLVDPAHVVAKAPAADRAGLRRAVRDDYLAKPFSADFWLDDAGRLRRVLVDYRTTGGSRVVLDGTFSDFGKKVDLTIPTPDRIKDITP